MIHFDRKTLSMLKYIKRCGSKGATWSKLDKKFGDDYANPFMLQLLSIELYTVTKNQENLWIDFKKENQVTYGNFRSFITPKGNELIERRCFDFWKWVVPTLISVAALIISVLSA